MIDWIDATEEVTYRGRVIGMIYSTATVGNMQLRVIDTEMPGFSVDVRVFRSVDAPASDSLWRGVAHCPTVEACKKWVEEHVIDGKLVK